MPKEINLKVICDFCEKDITYQPGNFRIKITYETRQARHEGFRTLEHKIPPLTHDLYFCDMKCCSAYFQPRG
jgi:hypothetical protein